MTRDEIYTPLEEAQDEIRRRWADQNLRRRVEEFLGGTPPGASDEPRAFLFRTIHSPNREFHRFVELTRQVGIPVSAMEYLDDRFCNMNADKLGLVRMTFSKGTNHHGERLFRRRMVTAGDINGRVFTTIQTIWGENLVDFHHRALQLFYPDIKPLNESLWLRTHGDSPKQFYPAFFARFIGHGVMFESYLSTRNEEAFTRDVVLPAFEHVCSHFGMKPASSPRNPRTIHPGRGTRQAWNILSS